MRALGAVVTVLLAGFLGCGQTLDTFDFGDGGDGPIVPGPDLGTTVTVRFRPADILLFVDSSASMEDEQESLALNFDRFVSQVAGVVDYRLAVVNIDTRTTDRNSGYTISTYAATAPYKIAVNDGSGCLPSSEVPGCVVGGAFGVVDAATMSRSEQIERFREVVRVGTCGGGQELGLDVMRSTLEQLGGCNAPFQLRPEANLILIFVTDEDDQGVEFLPGYVATVLTHKVAERVRVAVVGGVVAGSPSQCSTNERGQCGRSVCELPVEGSQQDCSQGTGCPPNEVCSTGQKCVAPAFQYVDFCHWCSFYNAPDCCAALPSTRYVEFARQMEREIHLANPEIPMADCVSLGTKVGCLAESICTTNFGDTLARIAQELVIEEMPPL